MPDPNELERLLRELATHRATLAIVLQQRANLGADYAPPGVHHAIADARAPLFTSLDWSVFAAPAG